MIHDDEKKKHIQLVKRRNNKGENISYSIDILTKSLCQHRHNPPSSPILGSFSPTA